MIINKTPLKAVLFDLDGTLVDTARDFVRIIHEMAAENGFVAPSDQLIREKVSEGSKAMVALFNQHNDLGDETQAEQTIMAYRQQFLDKYENEICVDSRVYEGLEILLAELDSKGVAWGVVTNKPRYLAEKLLAKLGLDKRCKTLVCPEDVINSKPNPEPMYLAAKQLGLQQADCPNIIYIGDHIRDIQAGNAAGMLTIIAGFGYISPTEKQNLDGWQADYRVDTATGLTQLILSERFSL